jgi:hypothetical protein
MTGNESERGHGDTPDPAAAGLTLTDRLNILFELRRQRDGRRYTPTDFARLILDETGVKVSHTWIQRLLDGDITNPGWESLQLLARFFQVSPAVFFGEQATEGVDAQLQLLAAMADTGVRTVATLSYGLSSETLAAVAELLKKARRAEGLEGKAEPQPASSPEQVKE